MKKPEWAKVKPDAPFWHHVPKREQVRILTKSRMKVGTFVKRYRQPNWCNYPGALEAVMGCWSLMSPGEIRSWRDCEGCELRGPTPRMLGSAEFLREQENRIHGR